MILSRLLAGAVLIVLSLAGWSPLAAAEEAADARKWKRIDYPSLPLPGEEKGRLMVLVGSGGNGGKDDEPSHLRFDLLCSGIQAGQGGGKPWDAKLPKVLEDPAKFTVRLHLSDGKIVTPDAGPRPPSWIGVGGGGGVTYSIAYMFPWQRNEMEEAWIECALPGQTYWVELPYGFTRNPKDPLPSDAKRGAPVFPPTMKALGEKDLLVPWLRVDYELGVIQNGWRLFLHIANPLDARAVAELYRDDMQVGKSMFLWKRDKPRTALDIKMADGSALTGRGMSINLHEDGMRRSDDYTFNRYPKDGRDWGKVVIKVDDKEYECQVPSSLFKYIHGVTDPENTKRLPRPKEIRDR